MDRCESEEVFVGLWEIFNCLNYLYDRGEGPRMIKAKSRKSFGWGFSGLNTVSFEAIFLGNTSDDSQHLINVLVDFD